MPQARRALTRYAPISSCAIARRRPGLTPFLQHLLEHLLVEGQIGDDLFEPAIFVLELAYPPELGDAHPRIALFPGVEGGLTDPELAADLGRGDALLGLAQGLGDLLFGEPGLLHRDPPSR